MKLCLFRDKRFVENVDVITNKSLQPPVVTKSASECPVALSPALFVHDKHENAKLLKSYVAIHDMYPFFVRNASRMF